MDPVVTVDGLGKRYGTVTALSNVSLSIEPGEIFGVIGPNGAGKTTLIRAITGTISTTTGTVHLFGRPAQAADPERLGVLPQEFRPPGRLTGRELIAYYAGLYDTARGVDAILDEVGMTTANDRWFERLSGGEQRRLCVGTALVNDPDVLVLDEPTTGIDPAGRQRFWQLLNRLRADGRTIVLTTHDMHEAETLSDRVALLNDGEAIAIGRPEELVAGHTPGGHVLVEPIEPMDPGQLSALPWPVETNNGTLVIGDVTASDLGAVIAEFESADIAYSRISWELPSLETVFLAHAPEADGEI